ncbi:hypothetical protein EXW96_14530 [Paenibacillus sp. JMULE4]|uniref:FecR family protein n=1 Tax=Paenibacillus sp. JMULE4 TaxID=2518342 RepID=UPI0015769D89|nr:FecR family protein [Paenibacillus sp. JMULE4]NTZ18743.1 hypothetical protein [Paenibacillus sp. JMULE4]
MEKANRLKRKKRAAAFMWVMMFALLFSMLSFVPAPPVQAKSVRAAVVVEVKGNVTYTKSGGSKSHRAYVNLSLNRGDAISTGSSSSVVIRIVDREDELTIGSNAEVYIADLLEENGGKKSKVKAWAGSLWAKVKSLVSPEDEFEVETPTAVMGVRGTQFMTLVDPVTGRTTMYVAAGIVEATSTLSTGSEGHPSGSAAVYPAQQIDMDLRAQAEDLRILVYYAEPKAIVESASPRVLEAFLTAIPEIQAENEGIKNRMQEQFNQGIRQPDDRSILRYLTQDELDNVLRNFDALVTELVQEAVRANKLDPRKVDEVNARITDPGKRIDLTQPPAVDRTAGLDPAIERLKQVNRNTEASPARLERLRMEQAMRKLGPYLAELAGERNRLAEENRKTEDAANQRASEALMNQLSDSERRKFLENRLKLGEQMNSNTPAPLAGGGEPAVQVPGPVKPAVTVKQHGSPVNGFIHLDLEMRHFTDKEPFYAVEAHLVYKQSELNYRQTAKFTNAAGAVFKDRQAAETLTQHKGETQNELIYAASQYETGPDQPVDHIRLNGSGLLARIPLQVLDSAANTANVELVYVKVVDKEGRTVYELTSPQSITVITR